MNFDVALSPCPNDSFLFYAWQKGLCPGPNLSLHYKDVENLNKDCLKGKYPFTKVSAYVYGHVMDQYRILPMGAALGFDNGQKLVSKQDTPMEQFSDLKVAIPGEYTTAHALCQMFLPEPKEKLFCLYHEVESLVLSGQADAGILLHESRFTFQQKGLQEMADFGKLWQARTALPLPLGLYLVRRDLPDQQVEIFIETLQQSIKAAYTAEKQDINSYMQKLSQEEDPHIIHNHLELFVNQETFMLSNEGYEALNLFYKLAYEKGLYPLPVPTIEPYVLTSHFCN